MALSLNSYAEYMEQSNEKQQARQTMDHPVRQVGDNCTIQHREEVDSVKSKYALLDNIMTQRDPYCYVFFNEENHVSEPFKDFNEKFSFTQNLHLSVPIDMLQYAPGGSHGIVTLFWRTPSLRDDNALLNMSLKVVEKVRPLLPEFHTRRMKSEFQSKCSKLPVKLSPAVLRVIYSELTLDASADQNPAHDERIRQAMLSEDTDLATDLRYLNTGRPSDTFSVFFQYLSKKIEEVSAADERRHNVEHLSKFVSVRDLMKEVRSDMPSNEPVPSESTVLFSFVPKNAHKKSVKLYKSIIPLQFKVQTRQLRSSHQDDHFCAANFKYIRQFAIKYRGNVTLLCIDDKAKVDFGEPGLAVSSGVRGKKSLVPVESNLSALDHDMQSKGSLTPSVALNVDIPNTVEESFYRGKVNVTYKDSIFQASNPFRHAFEICQMLGKSSPVLMLFSDGGPDHRITYNSVKLSLIVVFRVLDLDILVAGRTAPGHSWLNPAERIMSVLNIALQNVALMREESTSATETTLKGANSMADIRQKAERVTGLRESWMDSVKPIIDTLVDRTSRLTLKDEPFRCHEAATDEDIRVFEEKIHFTIDDTITMGQYQEKHLKSKTGYRQFLADHCRERHYLFQIRKCSTPTCCTPTRSGVDPPWVPDPQLQPLDNEHNEKFETLLGKDTTEKDRPSALKIRTSAVAEQMQGIRNAGLVGQNVRSTVRCYECQKSRCIYSTRKLSTRDIRSLNRFVEKFDYTCGSLVVPEEDALQGVVTVRLQMDCSTPVVFPYYADNNPTKVSKDLCCHCGELGAERDRDLQTKYRVVLPVCASCVRAGKSVPKRMPLK